MSAAATMAVIAAKKRQELYQSFRDKGALSPSSAKSLEDLGRGNRGLVRMEIRAGAVVETPEGLFYLDETAVDQLQTARGRLILGLMVVLVVVLLVLKFGGA